MKYDYIIIGSGLAGLNAARLIPKTKKVLLICKKSPWDCNTFWAQGGIATAVDEEDIQTHIQDTMKAGVEKNDKKAVSKLSENSKKAIDELIKSGFEFDRNKDNNLCFTKEAAHSKSRILHADGDATGRILHKFLLSKFSFSILHDAFVLDLLIDDDICYGVHVLQDSKQKAIYADNVIIASGGLGALYKYHTNATTCAGELQGICYEKGLALKDMEMLQFHPTVFKGTSYARKPLLSEALRGEGAFIVDEQGKRFMFDYHKDGELAPRDVVSRAIFAYHKKTKSKIYLSFKNFKEDFFVKRFPNIYVNLKDLGFNVPFDKVPISPAFHYTMGGIASSLDAKVLGMKNLYVVGEAACSGVHGANRLASNSLLEGLVFSKIAVETSLKEKFCIDEKSYKKDIKDYIFEKKNDKKIKINLRKLMWDNAGIVRERKSLEFALDEINKYLQEDIGRLLYLRLLTAKSILVCALEQKKSIGAHFIKGE